jgi:phage baseplate assembly protein gpV
MLDIENVITQTLIIKNGTVAGFKEEGVYLVETDADRTMIPAYVLQITQGAIPAINIGDQVLMIMDSNHVQGYIIGVINSFKENKKKEVQEKDTLNYPDEMVELDMPKKLDKVCVNGKRIFIEADEELHLQCGKSSILINRQGKIVIRGTNLISRSSGPNKIKGASVNIN